MKKSLLFAVVAVVLSACATKENPYTSELVPERTLDGKYRIYVSMPEFETVDASKAAISDAGAFSWTAGDLIDVVYSKGGSPDEVHTFECTNASTGAFEFDGPVSDGYAISGAYYPSGYNGTPSAQHFASRADAAKGFQMHATVSAGKLAFVHDNAMFSVQIQNVPLLAKTVWVNGASVDITSETGNVDIRIPVIPAASAKLGIGVTDAAWDAGSHNDLISKNSEKSAAIEAAKFYNLNDLVLTPEVHFLSGGTGWDVVDGNIIAPVANVSTKTRFAVVGGEEWFRYTVKYGALEVTYGYAAGQEYNNSNPFIPNESSSARISTTGLYTIAFNVLTGAYTVTKTGDVTMRLVGINDEWDLTSGSNPTMTNVFGHVWMWKGQSTTTTYKAYVDGETSWNENSFGAQGDGWWDSNIVRGTSSYNAGMGSNYQVVIALDFDFNPWFLTVGSASSLSYVKLRTNLNGIDWDTEKDIALTQHATFPNLFYLENFVVTSEGQFIPYDNNGSWWGVSDSAYSNMVSNPKAKLTSSGGKNMLLPVGTYNIYFSALNAKTITVIKLD